MYAPFVLFNISVIGHAMTTLLPLNDIAKMKRQINSDKPCLPSFAKAKEKQPNPQANASCFTFSFAPPHKQLLLSH
jgi:hypothetical protein